MLVKLKYVQHWFDHRGRHRYRLRRNGKILGELPANGDPSSPEFQAAYHAVLRGEKTSDVGRAVDRDPSSMQTIVTKRHERLVQLIIEERKARNIRQEQLARALRQNQSWVSRLESGQRRIDVAEFLMLAEVIGFDPYKMLRRVQGVYS
jgi:ribosome-binding protein aMBF1 (putative translation factor)